MNYKSNTCSYPIPLALPCNTKSTTPSALTVPLDDDDDVVGKRLSRLETFALRVDPKLWLSLAPHVFVVGEQVTSKMPRHDGFVFVIEAIQLVGDSNLFRCVLPNEEVHLFREREIHLAPPEAVETKDQVSGP